MRRLIIYILSAIFLIGCQNEKHPEAKITEPGVYSAIEQYISENKNNDYNLALFDITPIKSNGDIFYIITINYISPKYLNDKIYVLCDKIKGKKNTIYYCR